MLASPVSHRALALLFAIISAALVGFFCAFNYERKVQVIGVLLPESGVIRIVSSQVGVVVERAAREGQFVRAGSPLFVLKSERASVSHGAAEEVISSLLSSRRDSLLLDRKQLRQQVLQRLEAGKRRADDLSEEIDRIETQITLQQRRVALGEESVKRLVDLQTQNFVSSAQVQDKLGELLDQRQRLGDLERAKASSSRDLSGARAELQDLQIQAQRDQEGALRNIATLNQDVMENEARRQVVVRAPQDGVIAAISSELGQTVATNQTMASLLPGNTPLIAELYVPSRAAGFVKNGMDVLVRFQAYPYQKFGQYHGRVREISATAMRAEEVALPGVALGSGGISEPFYRVRVALDSQTVTAYGNQQTLKSGMVLDASVVLERRRLYEWVLDPLYTITGRI